MNVPPTNADHRLDPEEIFGAINFDRLTAVIVAVSGGSDSLGLLFLLDDLRKARASFPRIVAVTIDHELRPESAEEASYVAQLCRSADLAHRILNWSAIKPVSGVSAKARDARYALLREAADDAQTDMVLTGHTLDDQNETFMMRSARGGERGLAGMARSTLLEREVWLVRPLLGVKREQLRRYLRGRGIEWRDDPSNTNPKYERVRVRNALQEQGGADIAALVGGKARQRVAVNTEAAELLRSNVTMLNGACAEVSIAGYGHYSDEAQRLVMGVLLAVLGGSAYLPPMEDCGKALRHFNGTDTSRRLSLGRCIIQRVKTGATICREMRSIPDVLIEPGTALVWDGRYRVSNASQLSLRIRAAGDEGLVLLKESGCDIIHRASTKSSPALIHEDRIIAIPALLDYGPDHGPDHANVPAGLEITRQVALFDHILSGYDEILAASVAKLFGLPDYKRFSVNQIDKN